MFSVRLYSHYNDLEIDILLLEKKNMKVVCQKSHKHQTFLLTKTNFKMFLSKTEDKMYFGYGF